MVPHHEEGERLKATWSQPNRPERHVVPWTFVESCIRAKKLLKQIFVENGHAIRFHIHESISETYLIQKTADRILVCCILD